MSKHKIGFFVRNFSGGGAELVVVNLANQFSRLGYDTYLIVIDNKGPHKEKVISNVNIIELESKRLMLSFFSLRNILKKLKIQTLVSNMTHENIVSIVATLYLKTNIIGVEHNNLISEIKRRGKLNFFITSRLVSLLYPKLRSLICVSNGVAEQFEQKFNLSNVKTIYNPIEFLEYRNGDRYQSEPFILSVGRLTEQKNFTMLIDAFDILVSQYKYPGELLIAGDGELKFFLQEYINSKDSASKIKLLGFIQSQSELNALYGSADLFALTSLWEGFGNVIVEAMMRGTKVISTDCNYGPSEIINNSELGTLVKSFDAETYAKAMNFEINTTRDINLLKRRAKDFEPVNIANEYKELIE